jgi:hypothetical protein
VQSQKIYEKNNSSAKDKRKGKGEGSKEVGARGSFPPPYNSIQ